MRFAKMLQAQDRLSGTQVEHAGNHSDCMGGGFARMLLLHTTFPSAHCGETRICSAYSREARDDDLGQRRMHPEQSADVRPVDWSTVMVRLG